MSERGLQRFCVGSVAGIPIVHHVAPGFRIEGWGELTAVPADDSDESNGMLLVRHVVGSVDTAGMTRRLEVGTQVEYFEDRTGQVAVLLRPFDPAMPAQLLRTVRAGIEYEVCYDYLPSVSISRRDTEMSAFTLALATRRHGIMAHGCGFILPSGVAALCVGMSGAGKSTLGRMLSDQPGVRVLNDDRIVVTRDGDAFRAWSTPWPGRAGIAQKGTAELGVIGLIGRGAAFQAVLASPRRAMTRLLETMALPIWDPTDLSEGLEFVDNLITGVPILDLAYSLKDESASLIVKTLLASAA